MSLMLPSEAKGKPWRLRVVKRQPRVEGKLVWGYCYWAKREIVIWKGVSDHGVARDTLLHELLHRYMPWMGEEAVEHLGTGLDEALDMVEAAGILGL